MKRITACIACLALGAVLVGTGCGPKPVAQESILDTPQNHYRQGLRELERGNLDSAEKAFDRAMDLAPDYPGSYAGKALVLSRKQEYKEALRMADKAIGKDKNFIDAHIVRGQVLSAQKKGDDWIKDAVKSFDKALKIDPESSKARYYKGLAYKEAFMFDEAADEFRAVIAAKDDYSANADSEWELIQKIQRAAPGTALGKKIALIQEIDRSDLAVLLIEELKILTILEKKRPKTYDTEFRPPEDPREMKGKEAETGNGIQDIAGHWAETWIEQIVSAGVMELFPDKTFMPDQKITRANFAGVLQSMLILVTGDNSLARKYISSPSRFPDVNPSHYAYNAICLAVDRGFMKTLDLNGAFGIKDTVTGADALLMIRQFQNALRLTF